MNENENIENVKEQTDSTIDTHTQKKKTKPSSKIHHEKDLADLEKKISEAEEKLKEYHDKYLRLSAEFDNYRKRTIRERSDLLKYAGEETLSKILPVMDDFERALASVETTTDIDAVREGIKHIYSKFKEILSQQGIKEIDAYSSEFNTDLHEAVTKVPAQDESMKGKVLEVVQKGYYLNDKVIRFAKVIVGE